ncbi:hypothetical protein DSO57_1020297 [Entomophthora muscae]|uniref:Uncharacterized protein n=1 Tax=Entomophthora muscae TaxID=34485 RepID=A0ACC2RUX1_9FUNG|nr:hypothetical protein DSO57_1020297 [Entomophthora muscae]
MILSPEDLAKEAPVAQQKKVMQAWPIEGSSFRFGSWLSQSLTAPQFLDQVSQHLNSILMEPSKVLKCHELARTIKSVIYERFDGELEVFVTGSLKTGLLTKSSDLDLNVPLPSDEPSFNEVEAYIKIIANSIKNLGMKKMIILHRKGIRVPLIKFDDPTTGVSVDISLGKSTTIFKTKLLAAYVQLNPTVRDLLLFVKSWATARGINQATEGTINTYCHSTLLLAYLVMVNAIPNLQRVCTRHPIFTPFAKSPFTDPIKCALCNQVLPCKEYFGFDVYYCDTQITLSCSLDFTQLLVGFMDFMGNSFKSETDAISLRLGALVLREDIGHPLLPAESALNRSSRAYKDSLRGIKLLVVEDPIDSSVNVAASGRPWCMDLLNWEFRRCAYLMKLRQPIGVILAPFKQPPPHAYITEGIFKRHTTYL